MPTFFFLALLAGMTLLESQSQAQSGSFKNPAATPKSAATTPKLPEFTLRRTELEAHIRFLASDELQGRRTGEPGNAAAARYIAEQFRQLGLKPLGDGGDYFQRIPFEKVQPALYTTLVVGNDSLRLGKELIVRNGGPADVTGEVVYVGYGLSDTEDGYNGRAVRGRIVVAKGGSVDKKGPANFVLKSIEKRKLAAQKGAAALLELYDESMPWGLVVQYVSGGQIALPELPASGASMVHIWVDNANNQYKALKAVGQTVSLHSSGRRRTPLPSANVVGLIEGKSPQLKHEYVVLSAHFDHLGAGQTASRPYSPSDSIFNGARDNAIGTAALLEASNALSQQRPSRSVVVLALTGEEPGLFGSQYYTDHPAVPLRQTIFDLNVDVAGYEDTTIVSVNGLRRTGAQAELEAGANSVGLGVFADPAPEQDGFARSDNASFAAKGIPAPSFMAGFREFSEAITKYYHQANDEADSLDYPYLLRFAQAYAHAARLIADRPTRPYWSAGDEYEATAKALYGQK